MKTIDMPLFIYSMRRYVQLMDVCENIKRELGFKTWEEVFMILDMSCRNIPYRDPSDAETFVCGITQDDINKAMEVWHDFGVDVVYKDVP